METEGGTKDQFRYRDCWQTANLVSSTFLKIEALEQEALNTKKATDRYKHSAYKTDLEKSLRQGAPAGGLKKLAPALHDILPEIVEEGENKQSDFDYLIYRAYDLLKRISSHGVDSSDWKALTVNADDTRTSIFFH